MSDSLRITSAQFFNRGPMQCIGAQGDRSMGMGSNETREILDRYLNGHDPEAVAPDAEFMVMGTGQRARGRVEIEKLLEFL